MTAHAPMPLYTSQLNRRAVWILVVMLIEALLLHAPYDLADRPTVDAHLAQATVHFFEATIGYLICLVAVFLLVCWPERRLLFAEWRTAAEAHRWARYVLASVVVSVLVSAFTIRAKITELGRTGDLSRLVGGWLIACTIMFALLIAAVAPWRFWRQLMRKRSNELWISLGAIVLMLILARLFQASWYGFTDAATLGLSRWFLDLYESDVHANFTASILGAGPFSIQVSDICSGLEGIGMVTGFLAVYVAMFRRQLRFPNVLVLLPIGALSIWVLDAIRIALLVSVGTHVSQEIMMHGFHSLGSWFMSLAAVIGIVLGAHRITFFRAKPVQLAAVEG